MWNIELHEIARKERYRRWILGWNYVWTCRRLFMQIRQFVDTRGKKIRICIEILSCFLNATSNIFHSITNVTYSMDYFRVKTKLSNIESTCYYSTEKKKRKEWLRISFSSNVIPTFTSIEYINLHERSPNFTSLSACHPFENTKIPSTLLLVQTRHTPLDEEHSIRTMVERWIAFVVDERKKNEKKKKRHSNLSCTRMRGGEGVENSSVEPLTRDRCMHIWYVRERNPFCPSKSTPFCTFIAPRSHSNNCAPGCLLTPIRDNAIETYTARKDYRRIVCSIAIQSVEY